MTRQVSIATKIAQLEGLLGTADLNTWETGFVRSIAERHAATRTSATLTDKQIEQLERLWDKHFA